MTVLVEVEAKVYGRRNQGRHRKRWINTISQDFVSLNLTGRWGSRRLNLTPPWSAVTVRTRTQLAGRAFSISGQPVWNSLPSELRLIDCRCTFRRRL